MTLSDHRVAPQDSFDPDVELDLPIQSRWESVETEDDESHVIRGYD
ncbi:hypothetical protein [Saccharopolyspora flava]|uniref:Uncharacterized protein n=1 Tax=Saccharopolyspora flava TaxID=95161 RepID=A0A1I6SXG9_9PSEU|nr:hypothetical protein [Saccharopolyspora flava]SFS81636.1 hypothetical protein SAMN05660874_03522 [Saccharopolyspora flava]